MKRKKNRAAIQDSEVDIPTLTDVVTPGSVGLSEDSFVTLQADLTARVLKLADELVHSAARDMEAILLERIRDRLRDQIPDLIDETLRASLPQTLK